MKPRSAIILVESAARRDADALGRLLDFFGVRHRTVLADSASDEDARWLRAPEAEVALLASATGVVLAEKRGLLNANSLRNGTAPFQSVLVHAGAQPADLPAAFALLLDASPCQLVNQIAGSVTLRFSDSDASICGPFSGLTVAGVTGSGAPLLGSHEKAAPVIADPSQGNAALLLLGSNAGKQILFSASSRVTGIEALTREKYFDIKPHLFDLVPFVMFIKTAFADQIYKTDGVKACLIVDDPTLVRSYGHFNYETIFQQMEAAKFTTNVGFIPWNYRRSNSKVVSLVKSNSARFSIAVHGCDHTRAEFGSSNGSVLDWLARTANRRMESHKQRHRLDYDPVMIFPQGIFSAESAVALKRNNYWAAVNTDICASNETDGVPISEVMDLAITKYHSFPIVTRRYLWHGLENFAFDILLEKPCLIVTHHQDFKDSSKQVLNGIESLAKLKTRLDWSTLGDVVQSLHKRQSHPGGRQSVRLYAHNNLVSNNSPSEVEATFTKAEAEPEMLDAVLVDGRRVESSRVENNLSVSCRLKPGQTVRVEYQYKPDASLTPFASSFVRSGKVMLRRHLTEIRDRYLS
jgi:hypothetical protein